MEYPAIDLALAMAASYPLLSDLFASLASGPVTGYLTAGTPVSGPAEAVMTRRPRRQDWAGSQRRSCAAFLAGQRFWRVMCDQ
jgi:hypothetical protein